MKPLLVACFVLLALLARRRSLRVVRACHESQRLRARTLRHVVSFILGILVVLAAIMAPRTVYADERANTFALIVSSNRTTRLSRPDLRYADDDGAKYYEMFRMLAPENNVALLTTFDADSQKLFPDLVAKARPPSLENVRSVARTLAERIRAAATLGPVDFYFVFAGHGDIDQGKGFLELSDGPFTSDDLESLLRSVAATRSHVILDSCNSFFVINSRKPGGRHFVTSEEATKSLSERLPNVGVFLSTSAEAEVYEWSELQSGVFSHAVRSGLSGAADVNGDHRVSYDELRAFVNVASMDIKNGNFRPQVFARGPGGRGGDAIVDLRNANGARVRLDGAQRRLTVRDNNEVPWIDVHKEAGNELVLHVPTAVALGAGLDEANSATGMILHRYTLQEDSVGESLLTSLPTTAGPTGARGPDDMFRTLFARPFGPAAYAQFQARTPKTEPLALGVSQDERERMRLLLRESADSAKRARQVGGALTLPIGLGLGAMGGVLLVSPETSDKGERIATAIVGGLVLGGGAYVTATSLIDIVRPSFEERTYADFTESLALAPDTQQRIYAETERRFLSAAVSDRRHRTWTRWVGFGVMAMFGSGLALNLIEYPDRLPPPAYAFFVVPTVYGGAVFVESLFPTATERMAELWKNDPALVRGRSTSRLQVKPVFGLSSVGVSGTF